MKTIAEKMATRSEYWLGGRCSCGHYEYLHFGGRHEECVAAPGGKPCRCPQYHEAVQDA